MSWVGIATIGSIVGLLLTIAGFVFAIGKLVSRFENLEARVCEDRNKNSDQHKEFYSTVKNVEGIQVEISNLGEKIDEMKLDVREILASLSRRAT
jgi:hypothetical protein